MKKMIRNLKNKKAVTLISLVVTIIVLIILAAVAVYMSVGNNGLITKAIEAKELNEKATASEIISGKILSAQTDSYAEKYRNITLVELAQVLQKDNDIEYAEPASKLAATNWATLTSVPDFFYTKLKKYKYEFKVDNDFKLSFSEKEKNVINDLNKVDENGTRLSVVCSVGDFVQYSSGGSSSWKVWQIKNDGVVELISNNPAFSFNPSWTNVSMDVYLSINSNFAQFENNYAIKGSAKGATTKELYLENINKDINVCKCTPFYGAGDSILLLPVQGSSGYDLASCSNGTVSHVETLENISYNIRPVVSINANTYINDEVPYDSERGWTLK